MPVSFTSTYQTNLTTWVASTDGNAPLQPFTATNEIDETDGTEEPPVNPGSPGSPNPPLPLAYQPPGYTYPNFDPDLLPRVQNRVTNNLITSVQRTVFKINNVDYGNHFLSADYQRPIAGAGSGQVTLACQVTNSDYSLTYDSFQPYQRFEWTQVINGRNKLVTKGWITGSPQFSIDSNNVATLTLQLGDELELYANRHQEPDRLYCGLPPKTAGEAARIYAQYNRLKTTAFPVGHNLIEAPQKFINDSPWDFLQLLYSPTNQDVRCDKQGYIEVVPRANGSEGAIDLSFRGCLEVPTEVSKQYRPFTQVTVRNQYIKVDGFEPKVTTKKTVNGVPTNTSPWFQNGYTETVTTTYTIGGTTTFIKELFYGYVPTTFPIAKSSTESTGCSVSPLATEWKLITTKTFSVGYNQHISGSYLVWKKENWLEGLKLQENPTDPTQYILFEGTQEYSIETYTNVAQVNKKVCAKDYLHYKLTIDRQEFKLNKDFELTLFANSRSQYTAFGKSASDPDFYIGSGQRWELSETSGEYDEELKAWVNQPTNSQYDVTPPNSEWIRPNTRDIQAYLAFESPALSSRFDPATAPPQSAPCCFNRNQLSVYADRYLREQYGLSNAITVVIPDRFRINVGNTVRYTRSDGTPIFYLVFGEEYNQTGCVATKTLTLARTY